MDYIFALSKGILEEGPTYDTYTRYLKLVSY